MASRKYSLLSQELEAQLTRDGLPVEGKFPDADGGLRYEWLRESTHTVLLLDDDNKLQGWHTDIENSRRLSMRFNGAVDAANWALEMLPPAVGGPDGIS